MVSYNDGLCSDSLNKVFQGKTLVTQEGGNITLKFKKNIVLLNDMENEIHYELCDLNNLYSIVICHFKTRDCPLKMVRWFFFVSFVSFSHL